MTLTCAIVDDEPLALELLASYVRKTSFLKLAGTYSSAVEAMEKLPDAPVDLLFLDIQMPELDGLQFSKMVGNETRIVFTTAFDQYALEGYRVNALDYLLKPVSYAQFIEAVQKAIKWFEMTRKNEEENMPDTVSDSNAIYVKSEYKLVRIALDEVLYFESYKDYVRIYTTASEKPVYTLISLKKLEERLPSDQFLRIHRSYIIRKDKIRLMENEYIVVGHKHIPISKNYRKPLLDYLETQTIG